MGYPAQKRKGAKHENLDDVPIGCALTGGGVKTRLPAWPDSYLVGRAVVIFVLIDLFAAPFMNAQTYEVGGHLKYRFQAAGYPVDSLYNALIGDRSLDHALDFRVNFGVRYEDWDADAAYQLQGAYGDAFGLAKQLPPNGLFPGGVPNDDRRLFDFTHVITESDLGAVLHRLDRLSVGYTGARGVVRFGRQAISWGNGLIYNPTDFFNPFDPAAIDKEYKTGDDMLYGQWLQDNGNDLQAVWVIRRDLFGDISSNVDSIAIKYHGFISDVEYDLLASDHYDDLVFGGGAVVDLGGGVLRGDIMLTRTDTDTVFSGVASYSYSWTWWNRNISGVAEIFHNGFGQPDGDYSPEALAGNPDLIKRVARGELFTLGRDYVALSAMIEWTPLWLMTPNLFFNLSDGSALMQVVSQHDIAQDWQILTALNVPMGARGTEFGGIETGIEIDGDPTYLSTNLGFTFQLAWYF
jgi:hypothetical protein